jgi:hypothetical protein
MLISKLVHLLSETSLRHELSIDTAKINSRRTHVIFAVGKLIMITDLYIRSAWFRLHHKS